jgi:hypothetical protein
MFMAKLSKATFLFVVLLILTECSAFAQRYDTQRKIKRYWASIYNGTSVTSGILYSVTDSAVILISQQEFEKYKQRKDYKSTTIPYSAIDIIKLSRQGRFIKCLGLGVLAGTAVGLAIGEAGSKNVDPDSETSAGDKVFLGTGLGLAGGLVTGFIIGIVHKSYSIHNNASDFGEQKESLSKKSLLNE